MRPSLRRRLIVTLSGSLLALWIAAVAAVMLMVNHETGAFFDSELQETAQRLLSLALRDPAIVANGGAVEVHEVVEHDEYLVYQIFNARGAMLLRSHKAPEVPFDIPLTRGFHRIDGRHHYVDVSSDHRFLIVVAEPRGHRVEASREVLKLLLLPMVGILPLAGLAVAAAVGFAQKPINAFDQEIATRGHGNFEPLETDRLPKELAGIGASINLLLERLRLALEAERHFSANCAHELRTPLAAAMAQLRVLEDAVDAPAQRARVRQAREMLDRLNEISVRLLQLARAESGVAIDVQPVDVHALVDMVIRDLALQRRHPVAFDAPEGEVRALCDVDALGIAVQNLLANADRYSPPDSPITIVLEPGVRLIVRNDCEPIPQAVLATLGDRFVRASDDRSGTGLGLSIVQAIAAQSGGALRWTSPCFPDGRGFEAQLQLRPAEAAPVGAEATRLLAEAVPAR